MAIILPYLPPPLLHTRQKPSPIPPLLSAAPPPTPTPPQVLHRAAGVQDKRGQNWRDDDFYVNLGLAVRTLREDLPQLFTKDLNYHIYRDDITFTEPLNTFTGIDKYRLIFWALRFHGRVLFREISLDVVKVWQLSEKVILVRWRLRGVPRVPWEARGEFQGTSRYKVDRKGKIYEHKVDNLAVNFPPRPAVLDVVGVAAPPNPTFSCSWAELYSAVKETLEQEDCDCRLAVSCS